MCIDFRRVNQLSRKDSYPTPHMDTILNKLKRARYITTIDLKSAYHNIPLKKKVHVKRLHLQFQERVSGSIKGSHWDCPQRELHFKD